MTAVDLGPVPPLDSAAMEQARARWATRAKPPGALGRLEDIGVHLAGVSGQCPPPVPTRPAVVVFAGDHGVVADGASAWPAGVTQAMLAAMAGHGAAITAFAQVIGAPVVIVDVGVAGPRGAVAGIRDERVRAGTGSIAREAAMSVAEAGAAVAVGQRLAAELVEAGHDALVGGDMGIGNTTPSAALVAALTGLSEVAVTGAGAGVPEAGLEHKRALVAAALHRSATVRDPLHLLAEIGGLEIAALAGFYAEAARRRVPFVVDGVVACAALLVADALAPGTAAHAVAGHRSSEPAATVALRHLGLEPLLDLRLRLGEGTGAALAVPIMAAGVLALRDMADLPGLQT